MKASLLYRIASILLVLFAIGHTFGFRQTDPKWGIDALLQSLKAIHFQANGFDHRTFWNFYVGFGLFVTALMLLAAVFAWQMGQLSPEALASMRLSAWAFVGCFAFVVFLSWRYFFLIPLVFSAVILACLTLAASLSGAAR